MTLLRAIGKRLGRPVVKGAPVHDPTVARTSLDLAPKDAFFHHEIRLKRGDLRVGLFVNNEFLLARVRVANDVDVDVQECSVRSSTWRTKRKANPVNGYPHLHVCGRGTPRIDKQAIDVFGAKGSFGEAANARWRDIEILSQWSFAYLQRISVDEVLSVVDAICDL